MMRLFPAVADVIRGVCTGWSFPIHLTVAALLVAGLFLPGLARAKSPERERLSFNAGWRFIKGDPADAAGKVDYAKIKDWITQTSQAFMKESKEQSKSAGEPGIDISYIKTDFDDSAWRQLDLPHDWGIEGPFKQSLPGNTGKLPWWGVAWYRKHVTIPADEQQSRFFLDIDGAMSHAAVWLNGRFVGGWPYGYASFRLELTPYINYGGNNVLAIRLFNPPNSSRWYPGGGIYRNVWLVKTAPIHVGHWGTYITTPRVSSCAATVNVRATIDNQFATDAKVTASTQIYEIDAKGYLGGAPVAHSAPVGVALAAGKSAVCAMKINMVNPKLWDLKNPQLYMAVTEIVQNGKLVDSYNTIFGIRTIKFDVDKGFFLNGELVRLNGVCDHHDLGPLGSAVNVRALERQIEILKEMGCNAIRTSHNPPAPELLYLCDRLGMVVMDEAFDCWKQGKTPNDYQKLYLDWHEKDLRAMVRRDRNHPCVILWSTGNEINEQSVREPKEPTETKDKKETNEKKENQTKAQQEKEAKKQLEKEANLKKEKEAAEKKMKENLQMSAYHAQIVREQDPTRPVTAGCNHLQAGYNGFQNTLDVFGYNYKPGEYGKFREKNPKKPLFGSETASCISSRGEYFFPVSEKKDEGKADFQMSSYDLYAPQWATTPDTEFKGQDEFPFVAGEFVWTGFDYLGEPTPYNNDTTNLLNFTDPQEKEKMAEELEKLGNIKVPSRSSYFGIVDLCGFKKDRFYIYQARWRPDLPMVHILPHWNWPERLGQVTPVHVYTSGNEAELFLNGKSLGKKKKEQYQYRLRWDDVKYEPGELKAVAYKNGKPWAEAITRTTGPAAKLTLQADRNQLQADGADLSFITVSVVDKDGLLVPRSKNRLRFEIQGPGEIAAVDNGNATCHESFQSKEYNAYNGLCLVIVRTKAGQAGNITVTAQSDGIEGETINLISR